MSKPHIPYFSFYPSDFMNGVRGLSAQEVGVYTMLLCRIYEENGPVEYHPLRLATYCGMRVPTFESVVKKLVDLGKLTITENMLSNTRAEAEISKRSDGLKNNSKAGKASAEKRQQKQQSDATPVQQLFNHTDTDTDTDKKEGGGRSARPENPENLGQDPTDRERFLQAIGVDPVSGLTGPNGRQLGGQADMAEAARWLELPGLSVNVICDEMRRLSQSKRDGPPANFRYFTAAMQRLSGAITSPPLTPTIPTGTRNAKPTSAAVAFGQSIHRLADDLSAGRVTLETASRDPFRQRPRCDPQAG